MSQKPLKAADIKPRIGTGYPQPYSEPCKTREKRALGDAFGLTQFGVNLTHIPPGAWSAQRHWHEMEDEFVYVVEGELTLVDNDGEHLLTPGMCAGFKAGEANGHHLVNKSDRPAAYIEVGTRGATERVIYPDADMALAAGPGLPKGFTRKNGEAY